MGGPRRALTDLGRPVAHELDTQSVDSDEIVEVPLHDAAILRIDSSEWKRVPCRRLVDARTGDAPYWPTTVKLAATGRGLWIHFACAAGTIIATMTEYKDKVWQEDAVEVYLQPPGDSCMYEFQLSPIGTCRDLRVIRPWSPDRYFDDTWSCDGLETATALHGRDTGACEGWQAMFGIPWRAVGRGAGAEPGWRIGVYRIERDPLEYSCTPRLCNSRPRSSRRAVSCVSTILLPT